MDSYVTPVLPLIGRSNEMGRLRDFLACVKQGEGRTLILSGEGGVGKTRLLAELAGWAQSNGWKLATGSSYAVETGIPYALFSDAFLPLIQGLEASTLNVLTRGSRDELAVLFPALGTKESRDRISGGVDASDFKARLLSSFVSFTTRLAERQPLCIVIENLQWSDASSLELLHFLARNVSRSPVAILVSYNEAEVDANPLLRTTGQSLLNLGVAMHIRLEPLGQAEVFDLLASRYDGDLAAIRQFSGVLYGWTRGNPFFIEETMKELVASGVLRCEDGRWVGWDVDSLRLPGSVRDAVTLQLNRLSQEARELADTLSVVGAPVSFDQVAGLTDMSEAALSSSLDELCGSRIVVENRAGNAPVFGFAHPLLQQVLYESLGSGRRRMLHARIGDALEVFYGGRAVAHAGELALHYTKSGSARSKAVRYLSHAGRNALQKYANREAASFLSDALEQTEQLQDAMNGRDEIIRDLARTLQRLGRYDEALPLWAQARDVAVEKGDRVSLASIEYRAGLALFWSGRFDEALDHFDAGMAAGAERGAALRLHLAKAMCLQELARVDAARSAMHSALEVAIQSGDPTLLTRAHRALFIMHTWIGPRDLAREHRDKAMQFAERSGEQMLVWQATLASAIFAGLTSDAEETARCIARCRKLEEGLRSPLLPLWTSEVELSHAAWTGSWDDAVSIGERAIAASLIHNQNTLLPRLLLWTGLIYLARQELDRARSYFDDAWRRSGADTATDHRIDVQCVVPAHIGLAAYHLETGNYGEAIRVGEAGARLADRLGYVAWTVHWLLPIVGEAALWSRDFARVEACSVRIRRDADQLSSPIGDALADACDGMLLLLRDENHPAAIGMLRSAVSKLDANKYPDHACRVRRALAQALRDSGDKRSALQELKIAHDTFTRLGSVGQLEKVRHEIRNLGSRPPARKAKGGIGALTGREVEIARLVSLHKTNPEIGATLDISSRTVSTHLSNIFAKTGVKSRAELGDYVRNTLA
jgi:DNA-binding CsgD family transcriptional regulator/tetratricopeptide (TPR) repeat protein